MVKRKNSTSGADASVATISVNSEENFVRGGASALTPLEHREIANQAAKDLFETKKTTEAEPLKKKKKPNNKKAAKKVVEKPKSDKKHIEQLSFKKLTVGTCLLGCVSRINELELFVSLPHQLVGVVPITEVSDSLSETIQQIANDEDSDDESDMPSLSDMFHVGQWIRCKIISIPEVEEKSKKAIELTLKPKTVNEDMDIVDVTPGVTLGASVKSVEDHGYVLDLGIKDSTGFLPKKEAESHIEKHKELTVGQYVECLVEKKSNRTFQLTLDRTKISNSTVEDPFSRITSILPGQRVSGIIEAVQNNGLAVKMMGLYSATIDISHIPSKINVEADFKLGQKVVFRTLFTILNTEEKSIGGSLLPHALELDVPTLANGIKSDKFVGEVLAAGSFLENTKVQRVNNNGVWASLDGIDGVTGYVHISRLSEERIPNLSSTEGDFKIGSTHRARVLSYNPVDAIVVLTYQPSVLAEKYMRVSDIEVGTMVKGVVHKIVPAGVVLKLSEKIQALIPATHLADVKLSHPEYKFKTGKKFECRVLKVDSEHQKVVLTLKKSLINSEFGIFKNMEEISTGDVSHGVIVAIRKNGCIVGYYNEVTAFVPGSEMTEAHVPDLNTVFNVGQTVKTTVVRVDAKEKKMFVSMIAHKKKKQQEKKDVKKPAKKEVKEKTLSFKAKKDIKSVERKNGLKEFGDVRRNVCYSAYISNVTDAGVFLQLSKGISARVKIGNLSDEFLKEWKGLFKVGSIVKTKIFHIDAETKRLEATLKKSAIDKKTEKKEESEDEEMPEVDNDEDMSEQESEEEVPEEDED